MILMGYAVVSLGIILFNTEAISLIGGYIAQAATIAAVLMGLSLSVCLLYCIHRAFISKVIRQEKR
ncbi:hypothetical protein ES703_55915 [subsurface metagenome]